MKFVIDVKIHEGIFFPHSELKHLGSGREMTDDLRIEKSELVRTIFSPADEVLMSHPKTGTVEDEGKDSLNSLIEEE